MSSHVAPTHLLKFTRHHDGTVTTVILCGSGSAHPKVTSLAKNVTCTYCLTRLRNIEEHGTIRKPPKKAAPKTHRDIGGKTPLCGTVPVFAFADGNEVPTCKQCTYLEEQ